MAVTPALIFGESGFEETGKWVTLKSGHHSVQPPTAGNFAAASWKARTIAADIRPRKDT